MELAVTLRLFGAAGAGVGPGLVKRLTAHAAGGHLKVCRRQLGLTGTSGGSTPPAHTTLGFCH